MNLEIANRLLEYRKQHTLSQEELAARIGVSRQAVSKWERAEASPDTDNLIALARLCKVSLDEPLNAGQPPETVQTASEETDATEATDDCPGAAPSDLAAAGKQRSFRWLMHGLAGAFVPLLLLLYLLLGFCFGWWHPGWVVFLLVPVFYIFYSCWEDQQRREDD